MCMFDQLAAPEVFSGKDELSRERLRRLRHPRLASMANQSGLVVEQAGRRLLVRPAPPAPSASGSCGGGAGAVRGGPQASAFLPQVVACGGDFPPRRTS